MKMFYIVERASMLVPSGPIHDQARMHLFVMLTNPWHYENKEQLIIVSLSSVKSHNSFHHDKTCIITSEEQAHKFIVKKSYIDYSKARLIEREKLHKGIENDIFIEKGMIAEPCFKRIASGLLDSPHTKNYIKSAYRNYIAL